MAAPAYFSELRPNLLYIFHVSFRKFPKRKIRLPFWSTRYWSERLISVSFFRSLLMIVLPPPTFSYFRGNWEKGGRTRLGIHNLDLLIAGSWSHLAFLTLNFLVFLFFVGKSRKSTSSIRIFAIVLLFYIRKKNHIKNHSLIYLEQLLSYLMFVFPFFSF